MSKIILRNDMSDFYLRKVKFIYLTLVKWKNYFYYKILKFIKKGLGFLTWFKVPISFI